MTCLPNRRQVCLYLLALILLAALGTARAATGLDVVLVMDSSGSMKNTDAKQARIGIAKALTSVLGPKDRVSVVSFSDQGYPLVSFTDPSTGLKHVERALARVSSAGIYTNIPDALITAADLFLEKGDPEQGRVIVLMSDGIIDFQDDATTFALSQNLLREVVPELKKRRIRVLAFSFTDAANNALLRIIAEDTRGAFFLLSSGQNPRPLLRGLLDDSRSTLPKINERAVRIAKDTPELLLLVPAKGPSDALFLESPKGEMFPYGRNRGGVQWHRLGDKSVARLERPLAGSWRVTYPGKGAVEVVPEIDLQCHVTDGELMTGNQLRITAQLASTAVVPPELLKPRVVTVEVNAPDGTIAQLTLNDRGKLGDENAGDGLFTSAIVFNLSGRYLLNATAENRFLVRACRLGVDVLAAPVEPAVDLQKAVLPDETRFSGDNMPDQNEQAETESGAEEDGAQKEIDSTTLWLGIVLLLLAAGSAAALWWIWKRKLKGQSASDDQEEPYTDSEGQEQDALDEESQGDEFLEETEEPDEDRRD